MRACCKRLAGALALPILSFQIPLVAVALFPLVAGANDYVRVVHNNPGLVVDLGVGLQPWPLPMDYDQDGDYDLVVSCGDKPYDGIVFFENPDGNVKMPVFKPAVWLAPGTKDICPSYVDGETRVLTPATEIVGFRDRDSAFTKTAAIYPDAKIHPTEGRIRAEQWTYCDYDGDGALDLVVGIGDWTDYGWDNAYDASGRWTNGPIHGYVYLIHNRGTTAKPEYAAPEKVLAGGKPVDVFGMPSPNFADFDGDGDLDLLCGEFLDSFTYFENTGTRTAPAYAEGRKLARDGKELRMDLEMIIPVALDWDRDGDADLIVAQEDGRVAFLEHTGQIVDGMPQFLDPVFFQQQADYVKFGALANPVSTDWDGDGDEDLICGNTAGYIGFIENLDDGNPPRWAAPVCLEASGEVIRIMAGYNGSIQGPCEAKWGYTTQNVADWDHDGLKDIVVNSILGKVVWYRNVGTPQRPVLEEARPVRVEWEGAPPKPAWTWWTPEDGTLATQWRTTPVVIDFNEDGLNDLVMLDHEGYLAFFERRREGGELVLHPGKRIFEGRGASVYNQRHEPMNQEGGLLRLNGGIAGESGRRQFCFVDWDRDGKLDLLVNSRPSINFLKNVTEQGPPYVYEDQGPLGTRVLAGHPTFPCVVDWDKNGVPDLLVGAEDGLLYHLQNPNKSK